MTNVETVLNAVTARIQLDQQKLEQNLAWLQAEMHRYFFSFNKDDIEALTLLAVNLHRLADFKRLNLVNREERSMIAQLCTSGSLYRALRDMGEKNTTYAEITTSTAPLPGIDERLEVLRFDYGHLESERNVSTAATPIPDAIAGTIANTMAALYKDFDPGSVAELLAILWRNNEEYVRVSPPKRVARILYLYWKTRSGDGVHLDMEPLRKSEGREEFRLIFGIGSPPRKGFLLQIMEVLHRLHIEVHRSYSLTLNDGVYPYFLSTFYIRLTDDSPLSKESELFRQLKLELYNTQILLARSQSYALYVQGGLSSGPDATLINAMIGFCHTNLAHNLPDTFDLEGIMRAFHNHPDISLQLVRLFQVRIDPDLQENVGLYEQTLAQ
ncbi:MAG TPA: amino acid dehydrogenase, partial [Gammaproteobacteria bacterium]|nr:amino acid dehydrogenase [Gammaproteobacteria bacterium]